MTDIKLAKIKDDQVHLIEELEAELGISLVAYCVEDNDYANLGGDALRKIKELEKKLGVILLAYPNEKAA